MVASGDDLSVASSASQGVMRTREGVLDLDHSGEHRSRRVALLLGDSRDSDAEASTDIRPDKVGGYADGTPALKIIKEGEEAEGEGADDVRDDGSRSIGSVEERISRIRGEDLMLDLSFSKPTSEKHTSAAAAAAAVAAVAAGGGGSPAANSSAKFLSPQPKSFSASLSAKQIMPAKEPVPDIRRQTFAGKLKEMVTPQKITSGDQGVSCLAPTS